MNYEEAMLALKSTVPAGKCGTAEVSKFTVSRKDADWFNTRQLMSHGVRGWARRIEAGNYTRLVVNGELWMSDTSAECRDHVAAVRAAKGSVLITGLGLGCVVGACLKKPEVTDITVIEHNADVISLVGPHFTDPRLTLVHADAYEWRPPKGKKYDTVWHDIWLEISSDNLPEMGKLCRRFARRAEWQSCWEYDTVKRLRRSEYDSSRGWW